MEGNVRAHTSVVDENVDLSVLIQDIFHHLIASLGIPDIAQNRLYLRAEGLDGVADRLGFDRGVEVVDDDRGAALGESQRDTASNAVRGTRDQGDFAPQCG